MWRARNPISVWPGSKIQVVIVHTLRPAQRATPGRSTRDGTSTGAIRFWP
jgi:hypothetical protein